MRERKAISCGILVALFVSSFSYALFYWARVHFKHSHPPGYDRLMTAIDAKDAAEVESLLGHGVDPNAFPSAEGDLIDEDDIAPINSAAVDGSTQIVRILLDHGADPNLGDGWSENPLAAATERQSLDTMALLIERGAKVNDEPSGSSALWRAAVDGKVRAVSFLLDQGANPATEMFTDHPQLLIDAVRDLKGSPIIIEMLQKKGRFPKQKT